MNVDSVDRFVDACCFLIHCWGYASVGLVGLLSLAWITRRIRGWNE